MRNFIRLFSLLLVVFMLVSCSQTGKPPASDTTGTPNTMLDTSADTTDAEDDTTVLEEKAKFITYFADFYRFKSVESLVDISGTIFEGTVTNIFFKVFNYNTGEAPNVNDEVSELWLYTIYEFEVSTLYKGQGAEKLYFAVQSGIEGYKESEQIAKLKEFGAYNGYIRVMDQFEHLRVGNSYLIFAYGSGIQYPSILSKYQGIYDLSEPDKNSWYGPFSYNDVKTYLTSMQNEEG